MVKGAQKQMIVVRTGNSRYFDEAYFVLRRNVRVPCPEQNEMIGEANRILQDCDPSHRAPRKKMPRGVVFFLLGILCGGLSAVLCCLLIL